MVGLDHGRSHADEPEDEAVAARHAKIGRVLFAIYLVFYLGYMLLVSFWLDDLRKSFGGVNLAVLYGFGLITGALVLSLVYGWLCRTQAPDKPRG
jgi:uncharacterized membrane protein (DUF485 family)